jgi:hypothetical protein
VRHTRFSRRFTCRRLLAPGGGPRFEAASAGALAVTVARAGGHFHHAGTARAGAPAAPRPLLVQCWERRPRGGLARGSAGGQVLSLAHSGCQRGSRARAGTGGRRPLPGCRCPAAAGTFNMTPGCQWPAGRGRAGGRAGMGSRASGGRGSACGRWQASGGSRAPPSKARCPTTGQLYQGYRGIGGTRGTHGVGYAGSVILG